MSIEIKKSEKKARDTVVLGDKKKAQTGRGFKWWEANSKGDMLQQLLATAAYLKETQSYRFRQASIYSRLYGNTPIFGSIGNTSSLRDGKNLPLDRPTMNVVQSCIDTLTSRISQARPRPIFLTDNSDYKQRKIGKQLNQFINGEIYQTHSHDKAALILRDAAVLGTGAVKIFEDTNKRVAVERTLVTELYVDSNDAFYGEPRQLYQLKLVDRDVIAAAFPENKSAIGRAAQGSPDQSGEAQETIADQILVVEAWRLPSSKDADDGVHAIACSAGFVLDPEPYKIEKFPFEFLHYSPRLTGFWGQGLAEQLMGTQMEINKLLMTISKSIHIMGVPRVWLEDGSKVVKANFNNEIGMMGTYRGTPPIVWEGTSGIAADIYAQLQRLIEYAYQQSGVSALAATSQKPAGLNSGEAIRNYDDLQSDRFATISRNYDQFFVRLAYQIVDRAKVIVEREGSYSTIYPNKDGTKEINLKDAGLIEDPYVIQCFDASSLPRDPAGRLEKVTEMAQSGMITMPEARRLLDYPDLDQVNKLATASEERIYQVLDKIVENGTYTPPDPFMDLSLAEQICTQYYNLYSAASLTEERAQLLRDFFSQIQMIKQAAMPQMMPGAGGPTPQALPQAPASSPLLPNAPGA